MGLLVIFPGVFLGIVFGLIILGFLQVVAEVAMCFYLYRKHKQGLSDGGRNY